MGYLVCENFGLGTLNFNNEYIYLKIIKIMYMNISPAILNFLNAGGHKQR
jgi:hypothetical protein